MAASGQTFNQTIHARNISNSGALLSGLEHALKVGDVIGVQYKDRKTGCKVVWVMDTNSPQKMQAGIEIIADQDCPWKSELPESHQVSPAEPNNRRRFARHRISFPLEVRDERVNTPMRVNATDIGGSGCYVETILPLPILYDAACRLLDRQRPHLDLGGCAYQRPGVWAWVWSSSALRPIASSACRITCKTRLRSRPLA